MSGTDGYTVFIIHRPPLVYLHPLKYSYHCVTEKVIIYSDIIYLIWRNDNKYCEKYTKINEILRNRKYRDYNEWKRKEI